VNARSVIALTLFLTSALLGAQTQFGLGADKFPRAVAATSATARPSELPDEEHPLPSKVDLSALLPPVRDQGPIGSCAAWSTVYYARTMLEQQQRDWGAASNDHEFSPLFSYLQITGGKNEGTAITSHMKLLQDQGGVSLGAFPNTDNLAQLPPDDLKTQAAQAKIASYKSVPRTDDGVDLTAVKRLLAEGHPVVGGFLLFEDFQDYRGGVYRTLSGNVLGGHAMTVVGYDDQLRALRIVNSWGPAWGDHGFVWLSYDCLPVMTKTDYGFAVMYAEPVKLPVPAAPSDLTASDGESQTAITLRWTPVPGADATLVFRVDNETRDWKSLGSVTGGTFTDQNLPPGVSYVYAVRSQTGRGASAVTSDLGPLAVGSTHAAASVPGRVESVEGLTYKGSVLLVWPALADTDRYQVLKFDDQQDAFVLVGTTQDTVFRDNAPFGAQGRAIYAVVGVNAQGAGPVGDNVEVLASAPPPSAKDADALIRQTDDDKPPRQKAQPIVPPPRQENWFDPGYMKKAFADFAERERKAFADFKTADQNAFQEFLKTQKY